MIVNSVIKCVWGVAVITILCQNVSAEQCPDSATGQYPNCECISGSVYNQIHNECPPKQLKDLEMSCPKDASGYFPNCVCNQGKVYDHKDSICLDVNRSKCPLKSTGSPPSCQCEDGYHLDDVHWYCRPWYLPDPHVDFISTTLSPIRVHTCPLYHHWDGKDCVKTPCPHSSIQPENKFYPNCTFATVAPLCPVGKIYTFGDCHDPCPSFHYYSAKEKKCLQIKCPAGWKGDYFPHCVLGHGHTCPEEFPGVWPYCNIYDAGPHAKGKYVHKTSNDV